MNFDRTMIMRSAALVDFIIRTSSKIMVSVGDVVHPAPFGSWDDALEHCPHVDAPVGGVLRPRHRRRQDPLRVEVLARGHDRQHRLKVDLLDWQALGLESGQDLWFSWNVPVNKENQNEIF